MGELTLERQRERALALGRARARLKAKQGKGGTVMGRDIPHTGGQELRNHDPSFFQRMGDATHDLLQNVGLPANRMRRDIKAVDDFGRGVAHVATGGFSDEIAAGANAALGGDFRSELSKQRAIDDAGGLARDAGQIVGGVGLGIGAAKAGLSPAYNAAKKGASFLPIVGRSMLEGAIGAGLFGFGDAEGGIENRAENALWSSVGGAAIGGVVPSAVRGAGAIKDFIKPAKKVSPELARQVAKLQQEGVQLTAGQQTGSERLRRMETNLGGNKTDAMMETQKEQFTRAALKRIGVDAPAATADVIDSAYRRIGKQFDDLAARNRLVPDQPFVEDISGTIQRYEQNVPPTAVVPAVRQYATQIVQAAQGGFDGGVYQSLRSRLTKQARGAARDPELSQAYGGLVDALDNAMERSIANSNPGDLGAWQQARNQYRNFLVIERAATGPGSDTAQGFISPSQLRNAAISQQGRRNFARGRGDYADLARSGEGAMKPLPNSGTAANLISNIPFIRSGGSAAVGGTIGGFVGGPAGIGVGTAVGAATPWAAGKALMSGPVQNTLAGRPPVSRELIEAMMRIGALPEAREVPRVLIGR